MLTVETLRQSAALNGLTDAQFTAIAEMSRNDEATVIGTKIGALHGQYDADILSVTGLKKKDGEKSYDYAKRVLGDYKAKVEAEKTLKTDLAAAKAQVTDLQTKLEAGAADATLRQQLTDAKAQATQLQAQLDRKTKEFTAAATKHAEAVKAMQVDFAFNTATSGIKFKAGIPEAVQKILLKSAKEEVLAKGTPDFIDDGKGGQVLVMRGTDGNILNNPKNNLNPYTIKDLVFETSLKDVVDTGVHQTGGGTTGGGTTGGTAGRVLDLAGIKTQVEADRTIENHLLANGLTRDSAEFAEQFTQVRADNNVADLPIR